MDTHINVKSINIVINVIIVRLLIYEAITSINKDGHFFLLSVTFNDFTTFSFLFLTILKFTWFTPGFGDLCDSIKSRFGWLFSTRFFYTVTPQRPLSCTIPGTMVGTAFNLSC